MHTLQFSFHSAAEVVRERPAHYCVAAVSVHVQDFLLVGLTRGSSADLGGILNMGECFCELGVEWGRNAKFSTMHKSPDWQKFVLPKISRVSFTKHGWRLSLVESLCCRTCTCSSLTRNDNLLSQVLIYLGSLPSLTVSLLNFCYPDRHKILSCDFKLAFPDFISDMEKTLSYYYCSFLSPSHKVPAHFSIG